MLGAAERTSAEYASLSGSWRGLQERVYGGNALSFAVAVVVQAQVAYAERVISPAVTAGEIVRAARAADLGWQDPGVRAMAADLARDASCRDGARALRGALEGSGVADIDGLLALDDELRAALPVYGLANDAALCAVDAANYEFLESLSIADSSELRQLLGEESPQELAPSPHQLRIIARLGEDGQIEHGVELASGEQILPEMRHSPADAAVDEWWISSAIEVDGNSIGYIGSRRLADGRVELGFIRSDGEGATPDIRYLPRRPPGRCLAPQWGDRGAGGGGVRVRRMLALHQLIKIDVRFLHNVARTGELIGS